ncbi:MAG: response regulator [Candidatus Gastranaerophilales bacterium]|nr:response regulator [Candidatus Gastranaerophilales bacterium]
MKRILIVDDNETNLKILNLILTKAGYSVIALNDALQVLSVAISKVPDLILLDINMPDIDGFTLCELLKNEDVTKNVPVIFISALSEADDIVNGFTQGAVDYITKPYKAEEVKIRVATHLKIHDLQTELEETNKLLEQKVEEQVKKISDTQMETIFSLAKLAQSRDDDTGKHLERVQKYCFLLAKKLAHNSPYAKYIDKTFIRNIVHASPLHDIGKVGISDLILLKPGKLTPEEFAEMKKHTTIGADTLEEVYSKFGDNEFIKMGTVIARYHHERWDGNGYPECLKGEEIPLAARIMSIADVYDALGTKRVYKDAFPQEKCVQIIQDGRGTQFDPYIVDAFMEIKDEFYKVRCQNKDACVEI